VALILTRRTASASMPDHYRRYAEIGSISDGSLFLTFPTRALTSQHVMPSAG
jgi:hypothetical protein